MTAKNSQGADSAPAKAVQIALATGLALSSVPLYSVAALADEVAAQEGVAPGEELSNNSEAAASQDSTPTKTPALEGEQTLKTADAASSTLSFEFDEASHTATVTGLGSSFTGGELNIPSLVAKDGTTYQVTSIAKKAFYGNTTITAVTVGEGIQNIGACAFQNCTQLASAYLPDSAAFSSDITQTPTSLFQGCSALESVRLPEGSEVISVGMFSGCTSLAGVDIPSSVTEVCDDAFFDCKSLTEVKLPSDLTYLGRRAFSNCTALQSAVIPQGIETLKDSAFSGCASLYEVSLPDQLATMEPSVFADCTSLASVTFPQTLATIGDYAFQGCAALEGIDLPASVTTIGAYAFQRSGLRSLTLPATVFSVGDYSFSGCKQLVSVSLECPATEFGVDVFTNCTALNDPHIAEGMTHLGVAMFFGCTGLTELTFPSTLEVLNSHAFNGCTGLTEVVLPEGLSTLGASAFSRCSNLKKVNIPGSVSTVEAQAFFECTSLSDVTIGYGVQAFGAEVFYDCISLEELFIPASVNELRWGVFDACDRLKRLVFDGPMPTCIGDVMSSNVVCYYTVRFVDDDGNALCEPQIVKKESAAAPPEYSAPAGKMFVGWSEDIGSIEDSITVTPVVQADLAFTVDDESGTAVVTGPGNSVTETVEIPSSILKNGSTYTVTSIGADAFSGTAGITRVIVPATVETIEAGAFDDMASLQDIVFLGSEASYELGTIPQGVTVRFAVSFCDSQGAQIGATQYIAKGEDAVAPEPPSVEGSSFAGWDGSFTNVTAGTVCVATYDADYAYRFDEETRTAVITHIGRGVSGQASLPAAVVKDGISYKVVGIAQGAADEHCAATELTVPASVTAVEAGALSQAVSLERIIFQGDTAVEEGSLPSGAITCFTVVFKSKGGTIIETQVVAAGETAVAPQAPELEGWTFTGWSAPLEAISSYTVAVAQYEEAIPADEDDFIYELNAATGTATLTTTGRNLSGNVVIPKTVEVEGVTYKVTAIGASAFDGRSNVTGVTIPSSVTSIGTKAFANSGITSITAPSSVTSMGTAVFNNCTELVSADIQALLDTIPISTFKGCSKLQNVKLPASASTLAVSVFEGCSSLESIKLPVGMSSISGSAFKNCTSLSSIELPAFLDELGSSAFAGCVNLTSITIPSGVSAIKSSTFNGCTSLETVTLPQGLTSIGSSAFNDCSALKNINLEQTSVQSIDSFAFNDCTSLTSVVLPDTCVSLGGSALRKCSALESFTGGAGLKSIGSYAFYDCTSLKDVSLSEGLETIGQFAWGNCTALENIVLPDSVGVTEASVFYQCTNLKEVNIPTGLERLAGGLFQGCSSLESITIPDNITTIGDSVFKDCTSIKELVIPDSVTQIGTDSGVTGRPWNASTFAGMTSLESIKLPSGITIIGAGLFDGCTSLKVIYVPAGVTEIGKDAFANSGVEYIIFTGDNKGDVLIRDNAYGIGSTPIDITDYNKLVEPEDSGNSDDIVVVPGSPADVDPAPGTDEPGDPAVNPDPSTPSDIGPDPSAPSEALPVATNPSSDGANEVMAVDDTGASVVMTMPVQGDMGSETTAESTLDDADSGEEAASFFDEEKPEQQLSLIEQVKDVVSNPTVQRWALALVGFASACVVAVGAFFRGRRSKKQVE